MTRWRASGVRRNMATPVAIVFPIRFAIIYQYTVVLYLAKPFFVISCVFFNHTPPGGGAALGETGGGVTHRPVGALPGPS